MKTSRTSVVQSKLKLRPSDPFSNESSPDKEFGRRVSNTYIPDPFQKTQQLSKQKLSKVEPMFFSNGAQTQRTIDSSVLKRQSTSTTKL